MNRYLFTICFLTYIFSMLGCSQKRKELPAEILLSDAFMKGERLAELAPKKLKEVSGLAASINNPGLLWTHNDSGNDAEIYLIDLNTEIKQTYVLGDVDNRDWEDITLGPGPDPTKNYLYVGEIGDNLAVHTYKKIYRFEEPSFTPGDEKVTITDFETITFRLSDSKRDTEALLLDPKTKDLFVISKWSNPAYIYQLKYPYDSPDTVIAQQVGSIPIIKIVAADFSKNGEEVLIKTYNHVYYWKKNKGTKSVVELLQQSPVEVPYEQEPQGEAIAWSLDDSGFYTLSEKDKGKKSFLYYYKRK